jgi:ubiquinone/menaquinone biosynthesis C-methylase UbiE
MKRINKKNINDVSYWDNNIAQPEFGLRQEKYLNLAGKGDSIIELGCGLSPFLDKARNNFKKVVGLDFSVKTVIEARNKFEEVEYICGDALNTKLKDKEFDVSVAGEVIEHLEYPEKLLDEMARITKFRMIISTAKMEYNDPEHLWEFTAKDLEKLGKKYGRVKVEEVKSEWFPGRSYLFMIIFL